MITDGICGCISVFASVAVGSVRIHVDGVSKARTAVRVYHLRALSTNGISFRPVAQVEQTIVHGEGFPGIVGRLAPVLHEGSYTASEDVDSQDARAIFVFWFFRICQSLLGLVEVADNEVVHFRQAIARELDVLDFGRCLDRNTRGGCRSCRCIRLGIEIDQHEVIVGAQEMALADYLVEQSLVILIFRIYLVGCLKNHIALTNFFVTHQPITGLTAFVGVLSLFIQETALLPGKVGIIIRCTVPAVVWWIVSV